VHAPAVEDVLVAHGGLGLLDEEVQPRQQAVELVQRAKGDGDLARLLRAFSADARAQYL
jgi:hypothetical protein